MVHLVRKPLIMALLPGLPHPVTKTTHLPLRALRPFEQADDKGDRPDMDLVVGLEMLDLAEAVNRLTIEPGGRLAIGPDGVYEFGTDELKDHLGVQAGELAGGLEIKGVSRGLPGGRWGLVIHRLVWFRRDPEVSPNVHAPHQ